MGAACGCVFFVFKNLSDACLFLPFFNLSSKTYLQIYTKKKQFGWAAKLSDRNQDRVAVPYRGPVKSASSKGRPTTEIQLNTLAGALKLAVSSHKEGEGGGGSS